ncbi:MAG: hypothetical protein QXR76_03450 [Candidatus Bathyarchaeia archaeon]
MKKLRKANTGLFITTFGFLIIGFLIIRSLTPLVSVVIDSTPPIFEWTVPEKQKCYLNPVAVAVCVQDLESDVIAVTFKYSLTLGLTWIEVNLTRSRNNDGSWSNIWKTTPITFPTGLVIPFKFIATNKAGLRSESPGSLLGSLEDWFLVHPPLSGKWYIDNIQIESPEQELIFTSHELNFRFISTSGLVGEAYVEWIGTVSGKKYLVQTANSEWSENITLPDGRYKIDMVAVDKLNSTNKIVMTIADITIGTEKMLINYDAILTGFGLFLVVTGAVIMFIGKKSRL